MNDPRPIKRGGSATARARGDRGIVVHVSPATYDRLRQAARAAGLSLKDHCRRVLLAHHGIEDDREPAPRQPLKRGRSALPSPRPCTSRGASVHLAG